jgi:hypothetical protein
LRGCDVGHFRYLTRAKKMIETARHR